MFLRKVKRMLIFMRLKSIEEELKQQITVFYEYLYKETRLMKQQDLGTTINRLSESLKGRLYSQIFWLYLSRVEFLRDLPSSIYGHLNNQIQ